jgi:hypothetical protein
VVFDIFIQTPSLIMVEIAWWVRCMIFAAMVAGLIIVALGAIAFCMTRQQSKRLARSSDMTDHPIEIAQL